MQTDIFSSMEEKMHTFSRGQKSIARYIQENREQAAFMTAAKIAGAVGISESTVVRFALELGYSGYPEMQRALQEKVLRKLSPVELEEQLDGISLAFHGDITALKKTRDTLNRELLMAAVEVTARAGKVFVHGIGLGALLAEALKNALLQMRSGVYLLKENNRECLCRELLDGEDGDVFLELQYPGDNGSMAVSIAQKMGYVTVVFGSENGDYAFPCVFQGENVTLIPASFLGTVHAFLGALGDIRQDALESRQQRVAEFLKEEGGERA